MYHNMREKKTKVLHVRIPEWVDKELERFAPLPKSVVVRDVILTFLDCWRIASERGETAFDAFKKEYQEKLLEAAMEEGERVEIEDEG